MILLESFIHSIGFIIIYLIIDYKRKKPIVKLNTKRGWAIIALVILASMLIRYNV
jgi:hypothetical protein